MASKLVGEQAGKGADMKILAVDDEPLVLRLLDATLKGLGFNNADFATTGEHALHLLENAKSPYSCILLDIQMPGMSGIDLCQQIRKIPTYRTTPIIMLTALAEKEHIDESFASGATDYMNKPIDATELSARLRVAKLIQTEHQRSEYLQAANYSYNGGMAPVKPFEFGEAIQIEDVPRVVNASAMENYLRQLDRLGLFKIGVVGFQIRHAASLHASNQPDEFYGILADVAECIFENTRDVNALIAYLGSGAFVAVVPRVSQIDRRELEAAIAATLYEFELADMTESSYDLKVSVGAQINGSVFGNSPDKMIDLAVRSAQEASGSKTKSLATRFWAIAGE
jgi:CheY-like chemotaxis protein